MDSADLQERVEAISNCYERNHDSTYYPEECRRIAELEGFTHLGLGGNRDVFQADGNVVKFPRTPTGNKANVNESEMWNKVKGTPTAEVFVDVHSVAPDGDWLIMEQVDAYNDQDLRQIPKQDKREVVQRMKRRLYEHGWTCTDIRESNIGFDPDTGDQVFLDYGAGCRRVDR